MSRTMGQRQIGCLHYQQRHSLHGTLPGIHACTLYTHMYMHIQYKSIKSYHFRTVPSRRSETKAVITLSYYAVCVCTVPYRTYLLYHVPYCCTILYSGACVLSNKCTPEIVYSSVQCTAVRYGNMVRNGHKTIPVHRLHCTALNKNCNFFWSATVASTCSRYCDTYTV